MKQVSDIINILWPLGWIGCFQITVVPNGPSILSPINVDTKGNVVNPQWTEYLLLATTIIYEGHLCKTCLHGNKLTIVSCKHPVPALHCQGFLGLRYLDFHLKIALGGRLLLIRLSRISRGNTVTAKHIHAPKCRDPQDSAGEEEGQSRSLLLCPNRIWMRSLKIDNRKPCINWTQ